MIINSGVIEVVCKKVHAAVSQKHSAANCAFTDVIHPQSTSNAQEHDGMA